MNNTCDFRYCLANGLAVLRPYKVKFLLNQDIALQGLAVLRPYKGSRCFAPTRAPSGSPLQGLVVLRPYKGSWYFAPTRARDASPLRQIAINFKKCIKILKNLFNS